MKIIPEKMKPTCPNCNTTMQPVWFVDEEYVKGYRTGRNRIAVSYFECPICFGIAPVDDTFDGEWH